MTTQTEALKLALEALEWATSCISFDDFDDMPEALEELNKAHQAITAIKEALAQPKQEPDVYIPADALRQLKGTSLLILRSVPLYGYRGDGLIPLYTTPPQRKPLTDEEIRKLWAQHAAKQNGWPNDATPPMLDIGNGPRFQAHWHESEYQVFRAGFKAAHGIKE